MKRVRKIWSAWVRVTFRNSAKFKGKKLVTKLPIDEFSIMRVAFNEELDRKKFHLFN